MATAHIEAKEKDFANLVLMPGDPLRAEFIAQTFLKDARKITGVRNMYGFTGSYNGRPVSVMGSGMGMPSIGIYSYELFKFYGVEAIIRIGSAGAYTQDLNLYDVVLADGAYSESSYAEAAFNFKEDIQRPCDELNQHIREAAQHLEIPVHEGLIHSSDVFYRGEHFSFEELYKEKKTLCVEMESFALFANARQLNKQAACLLTISDSLITHEATKSEERQTAFTQMMKIALEVTKHY
ncbi:MAG: purine-nucleoside phosphorylase [Eubacteriales bacterium]|nr:purine-nucleoside phosphorylase [Eubacteriales bacterium]